MTRRTPFFVLDFRPFYRRATLHTWACTAALATALVSACPSAMAQGEPVGTHAADSSAYARADGIRTFDPLLVGGTAEPIWLTDGVRFIYEVTSGVDRGVYFVVDPRTQKRQRLLDGRRVAAEVSRLSGRAVESSDLKVRGYAGKNARMIFEVDNETYGCHVRFGTCERHQGPEDRSAGRKPPPDWVSRSPDGKWDAFIWNYNLYLRPSRLTDADPASRRRRSVELRQGCDAAATSGPLPEAWSDALPEGSVALTHDGSSDWGFGLYRFGIESATVVAERYRLKNGDLSWSRQGITWSPDSRKLVVPRDDFRGVRQYPLYSSTSRLPVDHSYFYAAPGDEYVPRYDFYVFDVARGSGTRVKTDAHGLLGNDDAARWGSSSGELFVLTTTRGSKSVSLAKVDPDTGEATPLISDSSATFVEVRDWEVADDGGDIFWVSERDGWSHVYRFDFTGKLKNRVTVGSWAVASIEHVDSAARQIWFTAWGKEAGVPYYAHLYRIGFDGSGLVSLSPEAGNHSIRFSPDGTYFLDTYSTIDTPPATIVRSSDGKKSFELERGDTRELEKTGWTAAEVFTVKARDGATDLWGIMHKPGHLDPDKKYPVIVNVYPGPQIGSVSDWVFKGPDSYRGTRSAPWPAESEMTYSSVDGKGRSLAELGFIVIQLDAQGTSKRSKAFQDFFYGRARDNGLPDQIAAVRQLADRFPWIDASRVGVWGHSGGGYSAAAAMFDYPDFFSVGVSQSGNHDFRIYGWYWGEKYQGLYKRDGAHDNFEDEANYKYASNLKGKLLIMSGDMDCNNPPAETLRVVDALIKADKDFDMLLVPDAGHQLPAYATKKTWDYFVEHLKGEVPAKNYRMIDPWAR